MAGKGHKREGSEGAKRGERRWGKDDVMRGMEEGVKVKCTQQCVYEGGEA